MIDSKIDPKPGDTWVCRDGTRVRIYAVDGEKDHSIHGAILCPRDSDGAGGWRVWEWTSDGFSLRDKTESRRDIIRKYDWREELQPVWSVLNEE